MAILAVILSVAIVGSIASYFYLDSKLTRKNILVDYAGPADRRLRPELADHRV